MRAPETDALPVAAVDVTAGPEPALSTVALELPPLQPATAPAAPSNRTAAHSRHTWVIRFSPSAARRLFRNQVVLRRYYLPASATSLPGIGELVASIECA